MANRTRQLSDLRADAVFLADLPTPTASTHITTQNLTDLVNAGIAELFNLVVRETNGEVYKTTGTIATVNGTTTYNLPTDFFQLTLAELQLDANNRVPLDRLTSDEHGYMISTSPVPAWYGAPFKYWLTGKSSLGGADGGMIEFLPTPKGIYTITLYYVFAPARLVADGDVLDGFAGFEDYAVLYAASRCLMRKGLHDEAAAHRQEMMRVGDMVVEAMKRRDAYKPPRTLITREEPRANWRFRRWVR